MLMRSWIDATTREIDELVDVEDEGVDTSMLVLINSMLPASALEAVVAAVVEVEEE
jgi:hypothetical protein